MYVKPPVITHVITVFYPHFAQLMKAHISAVFFLYISNQISDFTTSRLTQILLFALGGWSLHCTRRLSYFPEGEKA